MALYVIVAALPLLFEAVFTEHERHNAASAKNGAGFTFCYLYCRCFFLSDAGMTHLDLIRKRI
jgi:hypothetical protein